MYDRDGGNLWNQGWVIGWTSYWDHWKPIKAGNITSDATTTITTTTNTVTTILVITL